MKKLIVLLVMFCLATTSMAADPNATIVVMDPDTNNGSFEVLLGTPTGDWNYLEPNDVVGWHLGDITHDAAATGFWTRGEAYAHDGIWALVANPGVDTGPYTYFSDVLETPVPGGWKVTFSAAIGWSDGYVDSNPDPLEDFGQTLRLYAVNPADSNDRTLVSTISGTSESAGPGDWATPTPTSDVFTLPEAVGGYHFQVEVDAGVSHQGTSAGWGNLLDDVRVIAEEGFVCGDWGFSPADVTGPAGVPDCYVDLFDFVWLSSFWGDCTDPNDPVGCENLNL